MKTTLIFVVLACAFQICYSKSCYSCEFCGHLNNSHITWKPAPEKVKCQAESDKCGEITAYVYTGTSPPYDILFSKGCYPSNFECRNLYDNRSYLNQAYQTAKAIFGSSFREIRVENKCHFCNDGSLCNSSSSLHMSSLLLYSLFGVVWFFKCY